MTHQLDEVIFESKLTVGGLVDLINYMSDDAENVVIPEDLRMLLETRLSNAVLQEVSSFIEDYF
jgi:hypothetical protein